MNDKFEEEIIAANSKGVKLFLGGVCHTANMDGSELFPLSDAVQAIRYDVVNLERYSQDSRYIHGEATGDFKREIEDMAIFAGMTGTVDTLSPSLIELKEAADSVGCLILGSDISREAHEELKDKLIPEASDIMAIKDEMYVEAQKLLRKQKGRMPASRDSRVESLAEALLRIEPSDYGPRDVNDLRAIYMRLAHTVNSFSELLESEKHFSEVLVRLSGIGDAWYNYFTGRDKPVFDMIKMQLAAGNIVLNIIGAEHVRDNQPLINSFETNRIPYYRFINYVQSDIFIPKISNICREYS